jgi:hypothetical protein
MTSKEDFVRRAEEAAKNQNENRSWWAKLRGQNMVTAMEVLHHTANHEFRSQLDNYFEGVLSISLWEKTTKVEFEKLTQRAVEEFIRENKVVRADEVVIHYKEKALRFAKWLDNTKYRPFFMGSFDEIQNVIFHIRSIAN